MELATENTPGQSHKQAPPQLYHLHLGMTSMLALSQHLRRKLETEFGSLLQFEDLLGSNRVFVNPAN